MIQTPCVQVVTWHPDGEPAMTQHRHGGHEWRLFALDDVETVWYCVHCRYMEVADFRPLYNRSVEKE